MDPVRFSSQDLPNLGMLRLHGLITIMAFFLNLTLLGFVSHLNAHGILPLEFCPSLKADNSLKSPHPLIVLSFSSDLTVKLSVTISLTFRVFTFKEFVLTKPSVTLVRLPLLLWDFALLKLSLS